MVSLKTPDLSSAFGTERRSRSWVIRSKSGERVGGRRSFEIVWRTYVGCGLDQWNPYKPWLRIPWECRVQHLTPNWGIFTSCGAGTCLGRWLTGTCLSRCHRMLPLMWSRRQWRRTGESEDKGWKRNRVKLSPVEGVDNEVHQPRVRILVTAKVSKYEKE